MSEYEALNFDGLERKGNYRVITYREDILHIFEKKDAAAIIYQIIYRWQEHRRDEINKELERRKTAGQNTLTPEAIENRMWVYMSYNDFVRESGGAVAYNTVIRMLEYLVKDKKAIERRKNHDPHYGDYEYRINKNVMRQLLEELNATPAYAPKIPKKKTKKSVDSTQMGIPEVGEETGSTQMGIQAQGSTQMGIDSTQMGIEVYPNGGTSQITTHIPTYTECIVDDTANADVSTTPPSISSQDKKAETKKAEAAAKREIKRRVEDYTLCFQDICRDLFDDPDFIVDIPSGRSPLFKSVVERLNKGATKEGLHLVAQDMWDEVDENGENWWRDPKHFTLGAITKHYQTRLSSLKFKKRQEGANKSQSVKGKTQTTTLAPQKMPSREELRRAEV